MLPLLFDLDDPTKGPSKVPSDKEPLIRQQDNI